MENQNVVSDGDALVTSDGSISLYADNVYVISQTETETYDVGSEGSGFQIPEYYVNYMQGLLANMPDTDYVAFGDRVYDGGNNYSYTDYYYLVYDVLVSDGAVQGGNYPCYMITRSSSNSSFYNVTETTYSLTSYPSLAYGTVKGTSDLRKGVTHYEVYAVLLFLAVFLAMYLCGGIFKSIRGLKH